MSSYRIHTFSHPAPTECIGQTDRSGVDTKRINKNKNIAQKIFQNAAPPAQNLAPKVMKEIGRAHV